MATFVAFRGPGLTLSTLGTVVTICAPPGVTSPKVSGYLPGRAVTTGAKRVGGELNVLPASMTPAGSVPESKTQWAGVSPPAAVSVAEYGVLLRAGGRLVVTTVAACVGAVYVATRPPAVGFWDSAMSENTSWTYQEPVAKGSLDRSPSHSSLISPPGPVQPVPRKGVSD